MRDRNGTNDLANGAVRYGVYDAAGSLLRYEWLRPEDEPLEAGTPLTAGNLLTAQIAEKIWRAGDAPTDPMVNEAFGKLSEPNYHVGDILTTVRVLSAPWHACDGSTFISTHAPAGGATAIFHKSVMRFCGKLPKDDTVLCLASFGFPRRDPKAVYLAWISCANLPQKCVREGLALKDQGTSCFHEGLASHAFDPVLV